MNRILVLCLCVTYAVTYADSYESGINLYSFRYNTLDLDTILNSDRLVTNYVECLLNRKPCSPEGKELKRLLPEALRTKCAKCSVQQREGALKVLLKLYTKYPQYYNDLRARWDRTGEYHRRFMDYLREEKFNSIPNGASNGFDFEKDQSSQLPVSKKDPQNTIPAGQTGKPVKNDPDYDIGNRFSEDDLSSPLQPEASVIPEASVVVTTNNQQPIVPQSINKPSIGSNVPQVTKSPSTKAPIRTTAAPISTTTRSPSVRSTTPSILFPPSLFYIPPNQSNGGPLIGFINQIGTKITTTADLIADMLRGTIKKS